ncbi:hypothetical protein D9M70_563670 [compost metagenome]
MDPARKQCPTRRSPQEQWSTGRQPAHSDQPVGRADPEPAEDLRQHAPEHGAAAKTHLGRGRARPERAPRRRRRGAEYRVLHGQRRRRPAAAFQELREL